jgi:hypothetical protein
LGSTTDLRADGNGDLVVDLGDYGIWQSALGTVYNFGGGAIAGSEVPEPASTYFALVACVFFGRLRRRKSAVSRS